MHIGPGLRYVYRHSYIYDEQMIISYILYYYIQSIYIQCILRINSYYNLMKRLSENSWLYIVTKSYKFSPFYAISVEHNECDRAGVVAVDYYQCAAK